MNNVGRLLFLPLTGLLADKYVKPQFICIKSVAFLIISANFFRFGRLRVIVIGMLCCSIFGLIKSFSVNYLMYIMVSGNSIEIKSCKKEINQMVSSGILVFLMSLQLPLMKSLNWIWINRLYLERKVMNIVVFYFDADGVPGSVGRNLHVRRNLWYLSVFILQYFAGCNLRLILYLN